MIKREQRIGRIDRELGLELAFADAGAHQQVTRRDVAHHRVAAAAEDDRLAAQLLDVGDAGVGAHEKRPGDCLATEFLLVRDHAIGMGGVDVVVLVVMDDVVALRLHALPEGVEILRRDKHHRPAETLAQVRGERLVDGYGLGRLQAREDAERQLVVGARRARQGEDQDEREATGTHARASVARRRIPALAPSR